MTAVETRDERDERKWLEGYTGAMRAVLRTCVTALKADLEADEARWLIERGETVAALRDVCDDYGDNDWPDDLSLGDVIEKHLARPLRQRYAPSRDQAGTGEPS